MVKKSCFKFCPKNTFWEIKIRNEGFKQGYAKALADVKKIIKMKLADKKVMDYEYPTSALEEVRQEIASLSHSQQEQKSGLGKANSGLRLQSSADTHIPKESK